MRPGNSSMFYFFLFIYFYSFFFNIFSNQRSFDFSVHLIVSIQENTVERFPTTDSLSIKDNCFSVFP